jgi:hypothetical protein
VSLCAFSKGRSAVKLFVRFKGTSTQSKGASPLGKLIFESQSKLLIAAIGAASPIILQPLGAPPSEVEQLVHAIILYIVL